MDDLTGTRPSWQDYFLNIAEAVSLRADCSRRRVGAVVVKDNRIVASGYNGGAAGGPSCLAGKCPRGRKSREELPGFMDGNHDYDSEANFCIAIHAEVNALLYASRSDVEGAILYVTCEPCLTCWKIVSNSGIAEVVFPSESGEVQRLTVDNSFRLWNAMNGALT